MSCLTKSTQHEPSSYDEETGVNYAVGLCVLL